MFSMNTVQHCSTMFKLDCFSKNIGYLGIGLFSIIIVLMMIMLIMMMIMLIMMMIMMNMMMMMMRLAWVGVTLIRSSSNPKLGHLHLHPPPSDHHDHHHHHHHPDDPDHDDDPKDVVKYKKSSPANALVR